MNEIARPTVGDTAFPPGGGEMARLIRDHDWAATALGPIEGWPQALRTAVDIMLHSPGPLSVLWGPEAIQLYNDAYIEIAADRHPGILGRPASENWGGAYDTHLRPIFSRVFAGEAVTLRDQPIPVRGSDGKGIAERYFTASFSPIRDERGTVAGIFHPVTEVTERIRAEQRLRQSETRLRDVLGGMGEAFGLLDRDFRILAFSEAALRLETRPLEEIVGRSHWEVYPGSEHSEVGRLLKQALAEQQPISIEHLYTWENGPALWLEIRAVPVPEGLAVFWHDISERKAAEAEHLALAQRNAEILESISDAFYAVDRDWRLTYVNRKAEEWWGRSREGLLGRVFWEEFPQAVGSEPHKAHLRAAETREVVRIEAISPILGHWVDISIYPAADGGLSVYFRDISDKKRAEAELRESEARVRLMADAVPQIIWITDPDGRVEFFNKQWSDYTGAAYQPDTAADVAASFVHPDDGPATMEAFDEARATGGTFLVEHRIRSKSGDYRWFLVRGEPYRDPQTGRVVSWFGASVDIHDRRQAEAALRESEARLRFLGGLDEALRASRSAPDAMLAATELLARHLGASRCAYADVDADSNRFVIRSDFSVPGLESSAGTYSLDLFGSRAAADLRGGRTLVVRDIPRELPPDDGREMFLSIGISAIVCCPLVKDGRLAAMMAVHQNSPRDWRPDEIALVETVVERCWAHVERVGAEARLRELNATLEERVAETLAERNMLARLVEMTDVMVMAIDLDYNILALNAANADEFERIYGVRPKAGDNMLELLADQPEHQKQVRAGWALGMQGEQVTFVEDFGDPDRVRPYYQVNFRPLRDDAGEQIGVYQFVIDVTDRLRKEAQLAEAQEQLRQSQKMEAMGQLTGGVAHDFNNLLTPIIASLDMLLRRGVGSERERRLMDGALQSAERAKVLVQRLLAFARRQPLQPGPVDVGRLVSGMAELVASTLGPRIDVRVDLPDNLPPALADANQLEMAVLNLAVNARDAMPDAGVLTISAARESVRGPHPAKLRPGHYVRLSVKDTGTGMDQATLARAVEPFFSTKGVGRGTGLGLSMVHGLALQLGGGLTIASRPGQGTTVDLWLPMSAVAADEDGQAPGAVPAAKDVGTALLVDDEDLVRMSTADMLMDLGYEVVEARSAEEALRLVDEGLAPDLVVTDHLMPGLSGLDLARDLRSRRPELPVLIISGYAEMDGIAPGFPRLTKPFRAAELAESLAALSPAGAT